MTKSSAKIHNCNNDQEPPSMDEILKSIRGVIAGNNDDNVSSDNNEEILELHDMAEKYNDNSPENKNDNKKISVIDQIDKELKNKNTPNNTDTKDSLLDPIVAKKSSESLKNLLGKFSTGSASASSSNFRNGQTLEDLVIESLKPYLVEWLNQNLEKTIEKIVAEEIKKLIPKD